jgi:sugar phosphate permease
MGCWLLYASFYLCRRNVNIALSLMAQAGDKSVDLAHLLLIYGLAYAFGQFAAGALADRFGGKRVAIFGALGSAVCNALVVLDPGPHLLDALQVGNGLSQACGWSSILTILAGWFGRSERGIVMAWWGTSYVLGGFLATAFAGLAASSQILLPGWRNAFLAPALMLCAAAAYCAHALKDEPASSGLPPLSETLKGSQSSRNIREWLRDWFRLFRNRDVQVLSASYFFLKTMRYSLMYWLPLYLVQRMQYGEQQAAFLASLFEGLGFLGILAAGYISDRFCSGKRIPVAVGMLVALAFLLLLHPALGSVGPAAIAVSISLLGVLIYGPDLLIAGPAVADAVPLAFTGRATGIVNGVGSFGQMISASVVTIVSWFAWDHLFTLFVCCTVTAAALLATRWDAERKKTQSEPSL